MAPPSKTKKRVQRVFKFQTDEATVHVVMNRNKRRLIRIIKKRSRSKRAAVDDYLTHAIFYQLFPKNAIRPIGISHITVDNIKRWGMMSEIIRDRSADYKTFLAAFYSPKLERNQRVLDAMKRHEAFVHQHAIPLAEQIFSQTGINIDNHPVNVCNANNNPIFFEIHSIHLPRLFEFIKEIKSPKKKERLLSLAERLYLIHKRGLT